jgi:lysophospholipase L1-like esterase
VTFDEYIALGDSFSSNLYPALDAGATSVAVALEREPRAGDLAPLGAAALLHRNDDARWPEFAGRDLATAYPGIAFRSLVEDAATIGDVFGEQLGRLDEHDGPTLVTLTVGTTDVMSLLVRRPTLAIVRQAAHDIAEAFEFLVDAIRRRRPRATILVATVCDPSDGSALMPGVDARHKPVPLEALTSVNAQIRTVAAGTPGVRLADLHAHFLGHGSSASDEACWYWRRSPIDPNATGASEVRRVWLDALETPVA